MGTSCGSITRAVCIIVLNVTKLSRRMIKMGKYRRGVPDGTGPYKDSYMYKVLGRRGPRAGRRRGKCKEK